MRDNKIDKIESIESEYGRFPDSNASHTTIYPFVKVGTDGYIFISLINSIKILFTNTWPP